MKSLRRILVVDGSRVVRATLSKHLKDAFEVREEANGESAWQTLVLDSSIVAVISSVHAPKLEEQGLLQRLRSSALRRLSELPFLLIASESGKHSEPNAENTPGIAGFITKTMPKAEIIKRLRAVLDPHSPIDFPSLPEVREKELSALVSPDSKAPVLQSRDEIEAQISHALSKANKQSTGVSVLMFGIVNFDALIEQLGEEIAEEIGARFANLLLAKIGPHDAIARYTGERLIIVSHGVDLKQCAHFARRVCRGVAAGHITIQGQRVKLSATAGAATSLEQGITSARELLTQTSQRLDRALGCGGNAVVTDTRPSCPLYNAGLLLPKMLDSLNARNEKFLTERVGSLGLQILPLLKVLDQELALGLKLPDIRRQLQQRAKAESDAMNTGQPA